MDLQQSPEAVGSACLQKMSNPLEIVRSGIDITCSIRDAFAGRHLQPLGFANEIRCLSADFMFGFMTGFNIRRWAKIRV